ncbi:MAG: hypothetical protein MI922_13160, partial [Bacteroidales bacterium]|nr:hypothetical protein [Bacteroidales bacterium]
TYNIIFMKNQNDKQQEIVNQVYEYAANLMVNEKRSPSETQKALIEQGIEKEGAAAIVSNLEKEIENAKKVKAKKDILYGALWCGGGIVVTAITYSAASGGGSYVVAWGAILFGAVQLIKGLINSASS